MRVYHDWEFLESGYANTVKPISVGMLAENGAELYYEFHSAPWREIFQHEWLKENVVPHLSPGINAALVAGVGNGIVKSNLAIRSKVHDFLLNAYTNDPNNNLELWGWYSSYDHVCLAQLFGRMVDLPDFIPMWTNDLKQEAMRLGNPRIPDLRQPGEVAHNALNDARNEMRMGEWLKNYKARTKVDSPHKQTMSFNSEDAKKLSKKTFENRTDFPGWDAL